MLRAVGLGLRGPFLPDISKERESGKLSVDWFEVITENILNQKTPFFLETLKLREVADISLHGVSMSLGTKEINKSYLKDLKSLVDVIQPRFVSDHLCWCSLGGEYFPDLLPLPYTQKNIQIISDRIREVQDVLGRRIMVENISQYLAFKDSEMSEGEFLKEISLRADCNILLDVNNIYVNQVNLDSPWRTFLAHLPREKVTQLHVAGHKNDNGFLIDTHGEAVSDQVFDILEYVYENFGQVPTILERDSNIPPYQELLNELNQIQNLSEKYNVRRAQAV